MNTEQKDNIPPFTGITDKSVFWGEGVSKYTQGLFWETALKKESVLYSFRQEDFINPTTNKPVYSLWKIYMDLGDPTEYKLAVMCFASWEHFKRIRENKILTPYFDKLKEELEVKTRAEALSNIVATASESFQAAKFLVDKGWVKSKAGRPTKQHKEKEERQKKEVKSAVLYDLERLGDVK